MADIYDLPAEILVIIFSYCSWVEDLMSLVHVNQTWRSLTLQRIKWIKHLIPENRAKNLQLPSNSSTIYHNPKKTSNQKMIAMINLLRNLETVMISTEPSPLQTANLLSMLVENRPFIKRLVIPYLPRRRRVIPFKRLEGLALPCFFRWFSGLVVWCRESGKYIRQLHIKSIYGNQYELLFPGFVNLQRLHVEECGGIENFLDKFPAIDITTLEMEIPSENYIDNLLIKFPNIRNMWLYVKNKRRFANQFPIYPTLENLVLDFESISKVECDRVYRIRSIISSIDLVFPNLRTLAVRNHRYLTTNEFFALPANLPYLEVLDVVGCWNIDDNCVATANDVWSTAGRNIKIYHGPWHMSGNSPIGVNFIEDWFLRDFKSLPYFMESLDIS